MYQSLLDQEMPIPVGNIEARTGLPTHFDQGINNLEMLVETCNKDQNACLSRPT